MARIEPQYSEALAWLRYVLNPQTEMPAATDWAALYAFAGKQALTGIVFPEQAAGELRKDLRIQWAGTILQIEQQNRLLNRRIGELFNLLERDGFRCCLLKGQGNAEMYPNPLLRCTGDIDVWVDADEETICQYVRKRFPEEKESYKHIHFPVFDDTSVDIHVTPLKLYHPVFGKRLQQWIAQHKEEQFEHKVKLPDIEREVSVPTGSFNVVYQLGHMLIHLFDEGVGLRQVVDFFYVLKHLDASEEERSSLVETLRYLGMLRFARAMMWIESDVLGLPRERCLVKPDERLGGQLLRDILEGGNFGHYSQRYKDRSGYYQRRFVKAWHVISLLPMAPREGIARLLSKVGTALRHVFK